MFMLREYRTVFTTIFNLSFAAMNMNIIWHEYEAIFTAAVCAMKSGPGKPKGKVAPSYRFRF